MSTKIFKIVLLGIFLFAFQTLAKAQSDVSVEKKDRNIIIVGVGNTLEVGGKVTYIVAKETAKVAWKATKFSVGEVAAPVAEAIIVKAAPKVTLFVLKRGTPIAAKLVLKYIML